jgi:hypothetical protein
MHATAYGATLATANLAITAAAGQDNVAQTGIAVDRSAFGFPSNGMVAFSGVATLAANKKLSLKSVSLITSAAANMGSPTTLQTWADADVITDSGAGTTAGPWTKKYALGNLAGALQYIQLAYTADLNATSTDTCTISAVFVFDPTSQGSYT